MQNISPHLQQRILNQQNGNIAQTLNIDLSQKPDTVEISNTNTNTDINAEADKKPNKKKILKYVAIALGLTAVGAAIIFKGRAKDITSMQKAAENAANETVQKIQKEAEALSDEANEVVQAAQEVQAKFEKIKDEVVTLFNNGGKKDGVQVAKITGDANLSFLKEMNPDGTLLRKSRFIDGKLSSIEEIAEKNEYSIAEDKLWRYKEGSEILPDGTRKAAKDMHFSDGKLESYKEGFEKLPDGTEKVAKEMEFSDGKLELYKEGSEILPDGTEKVAKGFIKNENGKWAKAE